MSEEGTVDFSLPMPIKDFLFDLHDAMRRSRRMEDVQSLYDTKFKEITDKYFSQTPWPDSAVVSPEVGGDEEFLLFYREMTMRHITTKLKPQLSDHISSWANYVKLFEAVLNTDENDLCVTTQWVYDITQEFAYQFQGFCQFRCQVANISNNPDTLKTLEANRDVWNLPDVVSILTRLSSAGKAKSVDAGSSPTSKSPFLVQFGYFACIELARLECLMGDFTASLSAISSINLSDRTELFVQVPLCHFNVFYHTAVCHLMLRKFTSAVEVFSDIILHVSRVLKPGAGYSFRAGLQQQLQRMMDKALALTALASFLCPSCRLDDQVKEAMESKFQDKIHKLQHPDSFKKAFTDLFEFASPKFISPFVPDYNTPVNMKQDASNHILGAFMAEVDQHQSFLNLKSFFGLYATIDVAKLARFNEIPEPELICQLLSFKNKSIGADRVNTSDVRYFVDNGAIVIDSRSAKSDVTKTHERFFVTGARKHGEIMGQLHRAFANAGLE